jgi:hypothetical protein
VHAEVLPALDVLVMPLIVQPVPVQDLRVSAIRTFPIFTYLNHDRSFGLLGHSIFLFAVQPVPSLHRLDPADTRDLAQKYPEPPRKKVRLSLPCNSGRDQCRLAVCGFFKSFSSLSTCKNLSNLLGTFAQMPRFEAVGPSSENRAYIAVGSTTRRLPSKKTARMETKAKPLVTHLAGGFAVSEEAAKMIA